MNDTQLCDEPSLVLPTAQAERCQICLEDLVLDDSTVALTACGHRFCVACITAFLNVQIADGRVDLACFYFDEQRCQAAIDISDIGRLVTSEVLATYERFRLLRENPQARQCPFCEVVQVTTGSKDQPACDCTACDQTFCFFHADAHCTEESCAQFEKRQAKRDKRSGRVVKRISRPCPQCKQPIEKNGGCVHMTCALCKAEYCWWCGETWGFNYERHYSLLDAECCSGIANELVPGLASPYTSVRFMARLSYYLALLLIGVPATIGLLILVAWVWAPAVWRGEYPIRLLALVRFFAIRFTQAMAVVIYVAFVIVAFVTIVVADGLVWIIRKVRTLAPAVPTLSWQCCPQPQRRTPDKLATPSEIDSPPPFVVLPDLERGEEIEL